MDQSSKPSPPWNQNTKLVVSLLMLVIIGALIVRFSNLIPPLLMAGILSYVLYPLVRRVSARLDLSWRGAVNLIFLVFIIVIIFVFTATGFAVVDQLNSLVGVIQEFLDELPQLAEDLSTQTHTIGPFEFDFAELETWLEEEFNLSFTELGENALSALQPLLGQAGTLLGAFATSAAGFFAWSLFVLVISYFILADAGQMPDAYQKFGLGDRLADLRRLVQRLGGIWNAFLRGQLIIFITIVGLSFLLLTILGLRNALGLAFLTGVAKFVPYVGPVVASVSMALVAFFQPSNYLGFEPFTFAVVVVLSAIVLDQIVDTMITPRIYKQALGVHPAAVLIATLIAFNLLGVVGILLAAPVLATMQLFFIYALRKLLDLDPWMEPEPVEPPPTNPMRRAVGSLGERAGKLWERAREIIRSRRT